MFIERTIAAHQADRQIREFPGRRRRPSDFGGDMAPRSAGDRQATGSALSVDRRIGRRAFLKGAGALGAAGVIAPALSTGPALARGAAAQSGTTPLQHIIVDCQENRSFDHYYGFAPFAGQFGVPAGYSQPDGQGGSVAPFEFTSLSTPDIGHSWSAVHSEWDAGAMDGFFTTDSINCMGYYTAEQLPFYYSLFDEFTLCVNYFCSLLGPTWPNRFYLAAGTSGGITTNGVWGYGVFDYPFIVPSFARGWDEHPPADVSVGMGIQEELITALRESSAWESSAYILTYDEHGGYFDHVAPPQFDAYGAGIRVPTWVISPFAKKSHLEPTVYEHASTLKLIEAVFGLPALASVNHRFDVSTPGGPNNEAAGGQPTGPPAPPRDALAEVGTMLECFEF